jgi:hypothetical protein
VTLVWGRRAGVTIAAAIAAAAVAAAVAAVIAAMTGIVAGVAEPTWITPAQVHESTLEGSNVLQTV